MRTDVRQAAIVHDQAFFADVTAEGVGQAQYAQAARIGIPDHAWPGAVWPVRARCRSGRRHAANAWLGWDVARDWTAGAGLRYAGARHAGNAKLLRMPAHATIDLLLRWKPAPRMTLTLRGANLFDRRYDATAYYTPTTRRPNGWWALAAASSRC